jgi:hypothetical protein
LPVPDTVLTTVEEYREELMISLSSGRALATEAIRKSQAKYKKYYDRHSRETNLRVGDWVLVYTGVREEQEVIETTARTLSCPF